MEKQKFQQSTNVRLADLKVRAHTIVGRLTITGNKLRLLGKTKPSSASNQGRRPTG